MFGSLSFTAQAGLGAGLLLDHSLLSATLSGGVKATAAAVAAGLAAGAEGERGRAVAPATDAHSRADTLARGMAGWETTRGGLQGMPSLHLCLQQQVQWASS